MGKKAKTPMEALLFSITAGVVTPDERMMNRFIDIQHGDKPMQQRLQVVQEREEDTGTKMSLEGSLELIIFNRMPNAAARPKPPKLNNQQGRKPKQQANNPAPSK